MDEQQQEPPQVRSSPYQSPMHNFGSSILFLTNPEHDLHKLELTFRGMIEDKDGNATQVGEQLMNEKGISSVLGQIQTIVSQNTIMGDLKDSEIRMIIDFLADTLAKDLMVNRLNYGITNPSARSKVFFSALVSAYITLKRSDNGGERRFWKGSVQEVHTRVESPARKGGGLLGFLNPFKR